MRYHIWKSDLQGHGDWSEMLRIWNASRARLLADGVPPHRALPTCRPILGIWYRSSQYLVSDTLPAWKYDATMDGGPAREDSKFMEPVAPQPSSFVLSDDEAMEDAECGREEEWDESLFQSDADRLGGLMASRPGLSAAAARSASATRKTLMRINVRADAPLIMGQYKTSTLAVLARRMQDVHRSVFGDSDGPETPEEKDKKYWENLLLEHLGLQSAGDCEIPFRMGSDLHSDRRTSGRCEARTVPLARNFARLFPKVKKTPILFRGP